jgi:hypothetical protein
VINTTVAELRQSDTPVELPQGDAAVDWWTDPIGGEHAATPLAVRGHVPAKIVVGSTGVLFVSGNARHIGVWKVKQMPAASPRTYEDDLRAQVSWLWAEDWDSDEDAVYDNDEW